MNEQNSPAPEQAASPEAAFVASRKKTYLAITGMIVAAGAAMAIISMPSWAVSDYRNCADDAIISCGAITNDELLQKYDKNVGDVQNIYAHYGITRDDIAGKTSQIKSGTVYQDGRVVVDGKTVATGAYSLSRLPFNDKNGNKPRSVQIGKETLYEGPNMSIFVRSVDAYVLFRGGQFYRAIISSCANPVMAAPTEQPVYSCDNLKADKIERTKYRFTTTATAKGGASLGDYTYDFGDGTKMNGGKTIDHQYTKPGTYLVKVTANIKLMGETKPVNGEHCVTTITVEEESKTPLFTCNSLSAQLIEGKTRAYAYTLGYTAEGGASLTKVTYDFGDGTSSTFELKDAFNVTHEYATTGTYTTTTTLFFTVPENGKVVDKSATCTTSVSPETPPELPHTGLGAWIGGGLGLAAIAGAGYYYLASHKNLRDKLLKR